MGICDIFKTEDQKRADKILSMDRSRYKCGYDERSQKQRDSDENFLKKHYAHKY